MSRSIKGSWQDVPIRRLFRIVNGGTPTSDTRNWDGDVAWATPIDLAQTNGKRIESTMRTLSRKGLLSGSRPVPAGSLILSTRAPIGYVSEAMTAMAFNQGCRGLVPVVDLDIRYFRYQMVASTQHLDALGNGSTFTELSGDCLASFKIFAPPLSEQRAIADYLDDETERIDVLVDKNQRLVELLKERRQAIITQAVTKGLNRNVAMQDSGIEWLGDIPVHWETAPVNRYYSVQLGKMLQNSPVALGDSEIPYLKAQHVQWFQVKTIDAPTMWASRDDLDKYQVVPGDLLVCEGGEGGRCGILNHIEGVYIIQNALHRVRARKGGCNSFLQYVLNSVAASNWFDVLNDKATIAHFTNEKFKALLIPIPPLRQQSAIADYLDAETARIDTLVSKLQRQINLLTERRQAIITAAVAGKLNIKQTTMSAKSP